MKKKLLASVVAIALVACCVIGGTLAWLTDKTDSITNTFTVGNVDLTLTETTSDYKMVPGNTIAKNPTVTVTAGSEDCYVFVKVEKSANLDSFIDYSVDTTKWTALDGVPGVYYTEVSSEEAGNAIAVLTNNQVTVKTSVTKDMMDAITEGTEPTLTFTAYAIQKANIETPADAWAELNPTTAP